MKSIRILIIACAVIYTALFSLLGLFIYQNKNTRRASEVLDVSYIDIQQIEYINIEERADIAFNPSPIITIQPISPFTNINTIINNEEASKNLERKIIDWSELYNIELNTACLLVHVESDFNERARNSNSFATGLCQITEVCLAEFNRINHKDYTMNDMLIADKNLEVGFWYYARLLNDDIYGVKCGIYTPKDAYIAYNCGPNYFRKHKSDLYNGFYNGFVYNAGDRWDSLADMWT